MPSDRIKITITIKVIIFYSSDFQLKCTITSSWRSLNTSNENPVCHSRSPFCEFKRWFKPTNVVPHTILYCRWNVPFLIQNQWRFGGFGRKHLKRAEKSIQKYNCPSINRSIKLLDVIAVMDTTRRYAPIISCLKDMSVRRGFHLRFRNMQECRCGRFERLYHVRDSLIFNCFR